MTSIIPLQDAQQIVDIINKAMELNVPIPERVDFLLRSLQNLLKRTALCNLALLDRLERDPAPRVLKRFLHQPTPEQKPVFCNETLQSGLDGAGPILRLLVPALINSPRIPIVILGEDTEDREWYEQTFKLQLQEFGYEDFMMGGWSATPDRAIIMNIAQLSDAPPFTDNDRTLMSLMLRAVAPFIDREIFMTGTILEEYKLSERQQEVLMLMLMGDSEKEIARHITRSVHTVHTFIKQLYSKFEVSSRGELMAMFIDRTVLQAARAKVIAT